MTSLPTATIAGHTTQMVGRSEAGCLVGQRTRRLSQSAAVTLIDDFFAAVFLLQALPYFPSADLMKKASQWPLGSADGQCLSSMEWAVRV